MELDLSPETEKKLNDCAAQRGLTMNELVVTLLQEHFEELGRMESTLDRRYDELKSGAVKLIPGEDVADYFRRKSDSARLPLAS